MQIYELNAETMEKFEIYIPDELVSDITDGSRFGYGVSDGVYADGVCVCHIEEDGHTAVIDHLFVDEEKRGEGLGLALLSMAQEAAAGKNCDILFAAYREDVNVEFAGLLEENMDACIYPSEEEEGLYAAVFPLTETARKAYVPQDVDIEKYIADYLTEEE